MTAIEELTQRRPVIAARLRQDCEKYGKIDYRLFIDAHGRDPQWLQDLIKAAAEELMAP